MKPAKGSRENPAAYYKVAGKQGEKVQKKVFHFLEDLVCLKGLEPPTS